MTYYVLTDGNVFDGLQAMNFSNDSVILWKVEKDGPEPVKEVTIKQANKYVENGYYGKPVLIEDQNRKLDEDFYNSETMYVGEGHWETIPKNEVIKEYRYSTFVEGLK